MMVDLEILNLLGRVRTAEALLAEIISKVDPASGWATGAQSISASSEWGFAPAEMVGSSECACIRKGELYTYRQTSGIKKATYDGVDSSGSGFTAAGEIFRIKLDEFSATAYFYIRLRDGDDPAVAGVDKYKVVYSASNIESDGDWGKPYYHFVPLLTLPFSATGVINAGGVIANHDGTIVVTLGGKDTPDDLSIDRATVAIPGVRQVGELQMRRYDDLFTALPPAVVACDNTDYFFYNPDGSGNDAGLWCTPKDIVDAGMDASDEWGVGWPPPPTPTIRHTDLDWTMIGVDETVVASAASGNTNHDGRYAVQGKGYNALLGTPAFASIGYSNATGPRAVALTEKRIDLDKCQLAKGEGESDVCIDWDAYTLNVGTAAPLNWSARSLDNGAWSVSSTTDASSATAAAFKSAGGIAAAGAMWAGGMVNSDLGFEIPGGSNYWVPSGVLMDVTGDVTIGANGTLTIGFGGLIINGDVYALTPIIAPLAAGGPLHSLTVLAKDNGVI